MIITSTMAPVKRLSTALTPTQNTFTPTYLTTSRTCVSSAAHPTTSTLTQNVGATVPQNIALQSASRLPTERAARSLKRRPNGATRQTGGEKEKKKDSARERTREEEGRSPQTATHAHTTKPR